MALDDQKIALQKENLDLRAKIKWQQNALIWIGCILGVAAIVAYSEGFGFYEAIFAGVAFWTFPIIGSLLGLIAIFVLFFLVFWLFDRLKRALSGISKSR